MSRRAPAPAPAAPAAGPAPPAPAAPIPGAAPPTSGGRSTSRQWNAPGWAPTAGGILLGALADVLFVQYARGGPAEVKAWLRAKFLNNEGAAGTVGSTVGKGAQLLGGIYGGAGGGSSGLNGGVAPGHPKAPGGPARGAL